LAESIGERIKALRTEQGLTLADLGERANLSTSYLSQIERDKTTPSLVTLTAVAKALNVGLRYFFELEGEAAYLIRAERAPNGHGQNGGGGMLPERSRSLTPEGENSKLVVRRIVAAPHTASEPLPVVPGEEFLLVLAGELKVIVGSEEFCLMAGDSVHYDAAQPHCWLNESDEPCTAIWSRAITQIER
jgi:transcriptional regulator with XRE-family HTH domain